MAGIEDMTGRWGDQKPRERARKARWRPRWAVREIPGAEGGVTQDVRVTVCLNLS